jgi:hypothetical protein
VDEDVYIMKGRAMSFERKFELFVLYAIVGFLFVFAVCTGLGTRDARRLLAIYSFFMMGLYIFRGWYFKKPYDRIEIVGCATVGIALEALNYFAP